MSIVEDSDCGLDGFSEVFLEVECGVKCFSRLVQDVVGTSLVALRIMGLF